MEGERIHYKDAYGTVRWKGSIVNKEGVWVGVEWDDLDKGKHSGSFEGVQYFVTRFENHGSFVKESVLLEGLTPSISLTYAIFDKYADKNLIDLSETYVSTVRNYKKPIELVGTEKIQKRQEQISSLKEVALQSLFIATINPGFGENLLSCEELLLDQNLLNSWDQVSLILTELPQLHTLSLASNRIFLPLTSPVTHSLSILVLNKMALTFTSLIPILSQFPVLQELHLFKNYCNDLSIPLDLLASLKLLNLEDNNIRSWSEVAELCKTLPNLEKLILNSNSIQHIDYTGGFERLNAIYVENCGLCSWKAVEELGKFPGPIKELRLARNVELAGNLSVSLFRFNAVARIAALNMLSGSAVRAQERLEAERYYLRVNVDNPEMINSYRWNELIQRHGPPAEISCKVVSEQDSLASQTLNSNTVTILLRSIARASAGKELTKKLFLNMSVGDLKNMCSKLFGVKTNEMKLSFRDRNSIMPEVLEDSLKNIGYYILNEQGEIWVEDLR